MDAHKKDLLNQYKQQPLLGGITRIRNTQNGRWMLEVHANLAGGRNRFAFAQTTGTPPSLRLSADWKTFGQQAFVFEVLEELQQGPTQTQSEFAEELHTLGEIWLEKLKDANIYP